jgi:transcriptional regulator GlxA family with amidase domain
MLLRINQYLLACFRWESPPRVGELARSLGWTPDRFMETFRRGTGVAPSTYLKDLQVEAAKLLLLRTNMSIDRVAYATCFGTRRTLFREFRRLTGTSPSDFRERP